MAETKAVQIVEKVGGAYVLNAEALKRILQKNNVVDKKVAVLTVAGAFRKGKSFFLSNCARYLQCKQTGKNWMDPSAAVSGFAWRQSAAAVTEGILMWPEPFVVKNARGEEVAILLMDTEGAFDHKSSMAQCATVFALSALLSSVLVYNVMQDVQEDTLNHLQFFASYGSYALDEGDATPFQSLLFLIRDWQNDNEFGLEAGRRHLDEKLEAHGSSNAAMQALRKNLRRSFPDMKCALLPGPGNKICRGSEGTITVADMDAEFRQELSALVPRLIDHLVLPKEIGGKQINGADLLKYFTTYVGIFASGKLPEPKSIYDATADATHQAALLFCLEHYKTAMRKIVGEPGSTLCLTEVNLRSFHDSKMTDALRLFDNEKKMGKLPKYRESLKQQIERMFADVFAVEMDTRTKLARAKAEKEDAERRRLQQEQKAREEAAAAERERARLRVQMEKEKREKEEAERRRQEAEARRIEEQRRAREEAERREREVQQQRERERKQREEEEKARKRREEEEREQRRKEEEERERKRRAEEAERERKRAEEAARKRKEDDERERRRREEMEEVTRKMKQMELENARKEREREQELERARQQAAYRESVTRNSLGGGYGGGGDFYAPSYSNDSRSGTPSGRSPGRPRGSVMERYNQGIMPREGTRDYNRLQRDGFL